MLRSPAKPGAKPQFPRTEVKMMMTSLEGLGVLVCKLLDLPKRFEMMAQCRLKKR